MSEFTPGLPEVHLQLLLFPSDSKTIEAKCKYIKANFM